MHRGRLLTLQLLCTLAALGSRPAAAQEPAQTDTAELPQPTAAEASGVMSARLGVAAGLTERRLEVPSSEGPRHLDTGLEPALLLRLAGRYRSDTRFLGLSLAYASSVHARVSDLVGDHSVVPSEVAIRSHRFEAGLAPGLYLSSRPRAASLSLLAGYAVRAFGSVEVLRIPRFSLHGPLVRLAFEVPLLDGLSLRIAPEAQLVASISEGLRALAGLPRGALGLGAEVALQLRLQRAWHAALQYREAHVRATGLERAHFQDIERYLVLMLVYQVQ